MIRGNEPRCRLAPVHLPDSANARAPPVRRRSSPATHSGDRSRSPSPWPLHSRVHGPSMQHRAPPMLPAETRTRKNRALLAPYRCPGFSRYSQFLPARRQPDGRFRGASQPASLIRLNDRGYAGRRPLRADGLRRLPGKSQRCPKMTACSAEEASFLTRRERRFGVHPVAWALVDAGARVASLGAARGGKRPTVVPGSLGPGSSARTQHSSGPATVEARPPRVAVPGYGSYRSSSSLANRVNKAISPRSTPLCRHG